MYLAFDTETTGIDYEKNNLLTGFFVVLDSELNIIDTYNLKMKHDTYTVSAKALEVNKINLVKHERLAKTVSQTRKEFLQFLEKNKPRYRYIPVGHNVQFDIRFLKSSQLLTEEQFSNYFSNYTIDTMMIAQYLKLCKLLPSTQSMSLVNLCSHLEIKYADTDDKTKFAHDAEYDIIMTIDLLKRFINLSKNNETTNTMNIDIDNDNDDSDNDTEGSNDTTSSKKRKLH
jgi:DNA polymerase III epsilon subunit-like protein